MIYVMQECRRNGRLKIGYSKNPEKRKQAIQTGNPSRIRILGTIPGEQRLEKSIHRTFRHLKCKGGTEWFRPATELLSVLASLGVTPQASSPPRR